MPSASSVTFHPFAERFPLMSDDELAKLAESIKKHGLRVPLVRRASDGIILDGRNRYRACELAGVEIRYDDRDVDEEQSLELIADLNIDRRHLTPSQASMIGAELSTALQNCREKPASELEANLPLTKSEGRPETTGAKKADKEAAKKMNVSERSIRDARVVKEKAPELAKKVEAGEVSVSAAAKAVREAEKPHVAEKVPTDELGVPLPQNLLLPFQSRERFKALLSLVRKVEAEIDSLARVEGGELLRLGLKPIGRDEVKYRDGDLHQCKQNVKFSVPYAICPHCVSRTKTAKTHKDCKACKGRGWTSKVNYDGAPKDFRDCVEALAIK